MSFIPPPGTQERRSGLKAHIHPLTSVEFGPLGKSSCYRSDLVLASSSRDEMNQVKIWSLSKHKCLATIVHAKSKKRFFSDYVTAVTFSPDGKKLCTAFLLSKKKKKKEPKCIQKFQGHSHSVAAVAFSPNGLELASASYDGTIRLWSLQGEKSTQVFKAHNGYMHDIKYIQGGTKLLTCSDDKTAKIWLTQGEAAGKPFKLFLGHLGSVTSVSANPLNNDIIATSSGDKTAKIWNVTTEGVIHWVSDIEFSPNGQTVATCSYDRLVKLWSLDKGTCIKTFKGHDDIITCLAFAPDASTIATGSRDCNLQIWDLRRSLSSIAWNEVAYMPNTNQPPFGNRYRPRRWIVVAGLLFSSCYWIFQKKIRESKKIFAEKMQERREAIEKKNSNKKSMEKLFRRNQIENFPVGKVLEAEYMKSGIFYPARIMKVDDIDDVAKYSVKFLQQGSIEKNIQDSQLRLMDGSDIFEAKANRS